MGNNSNIMLICHPLRCPGTYSMLAIPNTRPRMNNGYPSTLISESEITILKYSANDSK